MKRTRLYMQPKIMPTRTLGLVIGMLCMIMVIMMPMVATSSWPSSVPPLSLAPSTESLPSHPLKDQVQRGEEQYQAEPEVLLEDYGMWNPTPYDGGGDAAPIPH
ncbi:hypothetical protein I3760_08G064000 [Carya illinoinensis]|uniref:Uncharacterized protein n=2 Tax=Carya illinoinensis TaxID=32201 RepID=A0A8T1PJF1_CARIL|nr:hypothetical protein I3760_08G064000 [Carya illinoinensis]KAG6644569.1 hypothetical protein CIPAW_08G062800 [Carya illinoinensis]